MVGITEGAAFLRAATGLSTATSPIVRELGARCLWVRAGYRQCQWEAYSASCVETGQKGAVRVVVMGISSNVCCGFGGADAVLMSSPGHQRATQPVAAWAWRVECTWMTKDFGSAGARDLSLGRLGGAVRHGL